MAKIPLKTPYNSRNTLENACRTGKNKEKWIIKKKNTNKLNKNDK